MDLPREYISYSQIRLYQGCAKKYYYTYIEKIEIPMRDKIYLGIVSHASFEHYFKEKIEGRKPTAEALNEVFNHQFDTQQQNFKIVWEDSKEENRRRGSALVKYFFHHVAPTIHPLMVEKELWADLPVINVRLKGILDLVETDFSITDFKTTTARWSLSRVRSYYLQVVIYRYLFEKTFGTTISNLKFKIIHAKNPTNINHQDIIINPKDVDFDYTKMFEIISYVVNNIKQGIFFVNENYSCAFCEFKKFCKNKG